MRHMTPSTSMSHPEAVSSIVTAMRASLPELVDKVVARIRGEIPFYAAQEVVPAEDLRVSVRANVDYILDTLTGQAPANLSAPDATGRTRAAQGAPLAEMLTAYRVGVAELWSALVAVARRLPGVPADDIIDLAGTVFAVQGTYSDAALAAYRDESRDILRTRERERAAMVEVILTGVQAKGTLWEVASALRLPLDGSFLVIAAEAELGHDPLPRAESALAVLDVRSVWRLDAEMSLGVLSLPDRSRNAAVLTVLNRHAASRIGASPVFAELRQAGWALQLARLALGTHSGSAGVEQFRDSPINMLVAAAPQAALETARAVLGSLLELPAEELDMLLDTFDAWVRASGSASLAGATLYCHPNTVRYRLRRIEAGTGRTLGSPGDVAELVTAVRAWRALPHSLRALPFPGEQGDQVEDHGGGGDRGRLGVIVGRRYLHDVGPHQVHAGEPAQDAEQFPAGQAAGLGGARAGRERGVQHVDVQRQVHGQVRHALRDRVDDAGRAEVVDVAGADGAEAEPAVIA